MNLSEDRDRPSIPSLLSEFGLTPLQSKIFILLVSSDGLSTSEVSKMTMVHRSDVYRALKRLSQLGLVEVSIGNPSRYYAIEPSKAVRLLVDLRRDELLVLESKTDALTEWLESHRSSSEQLVAPGEETELGTSAFRLVRGNAVTPRVIDGIRSAKSEILKVVSAQALRRHFIEFSEYEKLATARGVTVRVLTEIQPSNYRIAKSYSECVHLNHVANLENSLRYLVIDGMELLLAGTVISNEEPDRSGLSTKNPVLVNGCISYFEDLWSKSIGFSERISVLEKNMLSEES